MALLGTAATAFALGVAPGISSAQDAIPHDSESCSVFMCMYTSGYPARFNVKAWSQIPADRPNYGHFEFWGPGGSPHWNSPDRWSPETFWNASIPGPGMVCGKLWLRTGPNDPDWRYYGTVCHNVY